MPWFLGTIHTHRTSLHDMQTFNSTPSYQCSCRNNRGGYLQNKTPLSKVSTNCCDLRNWPFTGKESKTGFEMGHALDHTLIWFTNGCSLNTLYRLWSYACIMNWGCISFILMNCQKNNPFPWLQLDFLPSILATSFITAQKTKVRVTAVILSVTEHHTLLIWIYL